MNSVHIFGKDKSILEVGDLETSAIAEYLRTSLNPEYPNPDNINYLKTNY